MATTGNWEKILSGVHKDEKGIQKSETCNEAQMKHGGKARWKQITNLWNELENNSIMEFKTLGRIQVGEDLGGMVGTVIV